MSYITEIFDRADLQQIREFLINGVECVEVSAKSYKQRISETEKPAIEMIMAKFPEESEHLKITGEVYAYASAMQEVYMEIGLRCGAVLTAQLLGADNRE